MIVGGKHDSERVLVGLFQHRLDLRITVSVAGIRRERRSSIVVRHSDGIGVYIYIYIYIYICCCCDCLALLALVWVGFVKDAAYY
jgi:hypothetical protein